VTPVVLLIAASYSISVQDNGESSYSTGTIHMSLRHGIIYTHIRQTILSFVLYFLLFCVKENQFDAQVILSIFRQPLHVSGVSRPIVRRHNRMHTTVGTCCSFR